MVIWPFWPFVCSQNLKSDCIPLFYIVETTTKFVVKLCQFCKLAFVYFQHFENLANILKKTSIYIFLFICTPFKKRKTIYTGLINLLYQKTTRTIKQRQVLISI